MKAVEPSTGEFQFNDSRLQLTNYIQGGTDIRTFLKAMGNTTGRVALFGIPLQQQWSYRVDEVARYIISSPEATRIAASVINSYPDRFLSDHARQKVREWESTHGGKAAAS